MSDTITISFRAKLDNFSGGTGYKVPKLKDSHVDFSDSRSMLAREFQRTLNDPDMTTARLKAWTPLERVPGVVWAGEAGEDVAGNRNDDLWSITPIGSGFMATVSITLPFSRRGGAA